MSRYHRQLDDCLGVDETMVFKLPKLIEKDGPTIWLFAVILFGCLFTLLGIALSVGNNPPAPELEWRKADGDDTAWYRVVKIDNCEYLEVWTDAVRLVHKGDCPNPLHQRQ